MRALAHYRLEAGFVVGQARHFGVLHLVLGQHVVEPQRGGRQFVAQPQRVEHLGTGLANGDRALRRLGEGLRLAAVVDCQRVVGGSSLGQAGEAEAGEQGGKTGQHAGRSPIGQFG
ncbi:hypothetical protein D3C85_1452470 [compost metagenome]